MDYSFVLCKEKQDAEILSLVETVPLGEQLQLIYTARPSFFSSLRIFSGKHLVMGLEHKGKLVGCGIASVQERYFLGKPVKLGYLSGLRLKKEHRGKGLTSRAFTFLNSMRNKLGVKLFFCSIVDDNKHAMHILTKKRKDFPPFHFVGTVCTKLIFLKKGEKFSDSYCQVTFLQPSEEAATLSFLQGQRKNFFPCYSTLRAFGLPIGSFVVAKRNGCIVGLCAVWDQTSFRQILIKAYGFPLRIFVNLYNAFCFLWRLPRLPRKGQMLRLAYLSHLFVKQNDVAVFHAMLQFIQANHVTELPFLAVGLQASDPLLTVLSGFPGIKYKSQLYLASYDYNSIPLKLAGSFYPEIALL